MAQVEQPANLDRWHNPGSRLLTVILMRCGLRDRRRAARSRFDCVVRDGDGAPYLRYINRKMKREALVPIDEELEQAIAEQQQRILRPLARRRPLAVPRARQMNPDGRKPADHALLPRRRCATGWAAATSATSTAARASDPAPVAAHLRHPADQP